MANRLLGTGTGTPSTLGESQDTEFIVNIPLSVLRSNSLAPEEADETESVVSHLGVPSASYYQDGSSRDRLLGSENGDSTVEDPVRNNERSSNEIDPSVRESDFVRRWFVQDTEAESSSPTRQLRLVPENQEDHVLINIASDIETQRIQWSIPVNDIPSGSYELILGISSRNLNLKAVDSISFDYVYGNTTQKFSPPSEVIPNSTLEALFATSTAQGDAISAAVQGDGGESTPALEDNSSSFAQEGGENADASTRGDVLDHVNPIEMPTTLRWKLHEHITLESGAVGEIMVIMTIETWKGVIQEPGAIGLHFLELHQDSLNVYRDHPSYRRHHPFAWFIDVNAGVGSAAQSATKKIISYCFSGNSAYVALLTHSAQGQHLEIYRISQGRPFSSCVASWTLSTSKATIFDISVSWDGSQIVVLNLSDHKLSALYIRQCHQPGAQISSAATTTFNPVSSQEHYDVGQLLPYLKKHYRRGIFHTGEGQNHSPANENFIAFGWTVLSIFCIGADWKCIWEVRLGIPTDPSDLYPYWKEHLRGERMVLLSRKRGYVSTWIITKDVPIAAMDTPTATSDNPYIANCLSECGGLFLMARARHVDVYFTDTWTRLGSWRLPTTEQCDVFDVSFISGSEYIIIDTNSDLSPASHSQGYVVDTHTMTTVSRIHSRNLFHNSPHNLVSVDRSDSMLLYQSQATLGAILYSDRLVRSVSKAGTFCTEECTPGLFVQSSSPPFFQAEVVEGTFGPRDRLESMSFISITARHAVDITVDVMSIPLPNGSKLQGFSWNLIDDQYILVMTVPGLVLVWRVPATLRGDYELVMAETTKDNDEWSVCQHHQVNQRNRATNVVTKRSLHNLRVHNLDNFLDGIVQLGRIFKDTDDKSRQGIIRYFERYVNLCLDANNNSDILLARFFASWTPEFHEHLLALTRALFESPTFHWVPATGTNRETNPILILLSHLDLGVVVMDIVEVVVSYCVRQSRTDIDLRFLGPVFVALKVALKARDFDSGLMSRTMRSFAYFPARDYHFIMDNYAVVKCPVVYRRRTMLHKQKDPILQFCSTTGDDAKNKRFTPHLYIATFDMLWSVEDILISKDEYKARRYNKLLSWTWISRIQYFRRPLQLEDLDNPALIALIHFKWMKHGFIYWMSATIVLVVMIVYFLYLVLTRNNLDGKRIDWFFPMYLCIFSISDIYTARSVIITYAKIHLQGFDDALSALFIGGDFIWTSFLFLFLVTGLILVTEDPNGPASQYFITFLILLALSLLILQFNVTETVARFLSIIRRTMRSIWVFIVIFAYIILAFSLALQHVQYVNCLNDSCIKDEHGINEAIKASTFFTALSSTYFMTGGMYEFVEQNLKRGNWMVHLTMVMFLFTITIMLNILIGLVNHAFENDDRTSRLEWMANRLASVTRAENTLRGINYFKRKDWFPEKIYYTGTPQEVRDYMQETQRLSEKAAHVALPLKTDQRDDSMATTDKPTEPASTCTTETQESQQQQQQQPWVDQLKEDMTAEFKKQLKAQKKQSDEQMAQMQAQLKEIMAVLRAGPRGE